MIWKASRNVKSRERSGICSNWKRFVGVVVVVEDVGVDWEPVWAKAELFLLRWSFSSKLGSICDNAKNKDDDDNDDDDNDDDDDDDNDDYDYDYDDDTIAEDQKERKAYRVFFWKNIFKFFYCFFNYVYFTNFVESKSICIRIGKST